VNGSMAMGIYDVFLSLLHAGRLMIAWASRQQWCAAPVCSASSDVWRGSRS
jgi:hypothetical protein